MTDKCKCDIKWTRLTNDQCHMFDISVLKMCANKHHIYPYFVQDEDGDYYASKELCEGELSGKIIYYCVQCKTKIEE
jgi:hypothetical protein